MGGIIGAAFGTEIDQCYNSGSIQGTTLSAGGVVGYMGQGGAPTLMNVYNTGTVKNTSINTSAKSGGLIGYNFVGKVSNSYNVGKIMGSKTGSLVGEDKYATPTNYSNLYYLESTGLKGIGNILNENVDVTIKELINFADSQIVTDLNKDDNNAFKQGNPYPVLTWQEDAAPKLDSPQQTLEGVIITFTDDTAAWKDKIYEINVNGKVLEGDQYTLAEGKISLNNSLFASAGNYLIAIKASGYSDATITLTLTLNLNPIYTIIAGEKASYTIGATSDGIKTMTVGNFKGSLDFTVDVTSVYSHSGEESVVFVLLRGGSQSDQVVDIHEVRQDFDAEGNNSATATFEVQTGDIVKVYMLDQLSNALDSNPMILQ